MKKILEEVYKLFGKIWFKLIVQLLIISFLFLTYYLVRYVLPEKYKIKEKTIRDLYKRIFVFLAQIPHKDDDIVKLINKSKSIFYEIFDKKSSEDINLYIEKFSIRNNLEFQFDPTFLTNILPSIEKLSKSEIVDNFSADILIYKLDFGVNQVLYIAKTKAYTILSNDYVASNYFCHTKGFKYKELTNKLLELYDNKLYVCMNDKGMLTFQKFSYNFSKEDYIPDNEFLNKITNEIKFFKNKNIQRSYIFYGLPGTGKTSCALELSEKISNNIIEIDSNVFINFGANITKFLFENIKSNVIIVNDIDKIKEDGISSLLHGLETVKTFETKPTLIATVNEINKLDKAIIRPGRFDDIILFENPDNEKRRMFINILLNKHHINITEEDLNKFVQATDGMTQAYIKEYCLQYENDEDIDIVIRKINERKKILKGR